MPLLKSLPWMESVDAKIVRAREHLDVFYREALDFTRATKRNIVLNVAADGSSAWMACWTDDPYPPIRLSVLAGDCVFNLRSALDNLVCGLVRTKNPRSQCSELSFPIRTDATVYQAVRAKALKGVPKDAKAVIDSLQPYNRPPASIKIDPLNILNELCNLDKHRAVNLMSGYSRNTQFVIHGNDGVVHRITVPGPLFGEAPETIPLSIDPATIHPSAHVETMGTAVIAFRDEGPWAERPVLEVLTACMRYVEDRVIPRFKPFFS